MVFTFPKSGAHLLKKNRFEFQLPDDETIYSLPKLEFTPPEGEDYIAEVADKPLNERAFVFGLIDVLDPDLGQKVRAARLSRDQVKAFYAAWLNAGRIKDPGESSGSERS